MFQIFHWIFLDRRWAWVTETMENEATDKGGYLMASWWGPHVEAFAQCLVPSNCPVSVSFCYYMPKINQDETVHTINILAMNHGSSPPLRSPFLWFLLERLRVWERPGVLVLHTCLSVVAFSWDKDPFNACAWATFQYLLYHLMLNLAHRRASWNYSRAKYNFYNRSRFHNFVWAKSCYKKCHQTLILTTL